MTPATRCAVALKTLDWSGRTLAARLGRGETTIRRWLSGDYEPPEELVAWLESLARHQQANPPPAL